MKPSKKVSTWPEPPSEALLTSPQLATLLQVSIATISRQVKAKIIPCVRVGHQVRFSRQAVLDALQKRRSA